MTFDHEYSRLNPQQKQAVDTIEGPVLLVAGPGTGKTQVLAMRIANILNQTDAQPQNILCLTYTEAGTTAMRNRLLKMIGSSAYHVRIHTFHSFCNEIIQNYPEKFSIAKELSQLDDLRRVKMLRSLLENLDSERNWLIRPFGNPYYYQGDILNAIQTLKREGKSVEDFRTLADEDLKYWESNQTINPRTNKPTQKSADALKQAQKNVELADIYSHYSDWMNENGYYDYEDMIMFVITALTQDADLLSGLQEKYQYILVDEYQDTNGAQNQIIKLLGSYDDSPNIFVVGDDDQAIYRFQGASVENLLFFAKQFTNVATLPLTFNYRSSQLILDAAGDVIEHNHLRLVNILQDLTKKLTAQFDIPNQHIEVFKLADDLTEVNFVVSKIQELVKAGVQHDDIAVLYRRHSDSADIAQGMMKAGIPMQIAVGENLLENRRVQQFITILRLINDQDKQREMLLFSLLHYGFMNLDNVDVFKLVRYARDTRSDLFNIISDETSLQNAGVKDHAQFSKVAEMIARWASESERLMLSELLELVGVESGLTDSLFQGEANVEDIQSVQAFFKYVREWNRADRQLKLADLIADLDMLEANHLALKGNVQDFERNGVHMLTAHSSKGLEFKYVFLVKFHDKSWGAGGRSSAIKLPGSVFGLPEISDAAVDLDMEDERRLVYVALTRAKEQIYISYAEKYASGQNSREVSPSPFLNEISPNFVHQADVATYSEINLERAKQSLSPILPTSEAEQSYLRYLLDEKFTLSASALNEYLNCPVSFKYNYLIQVPKAGDRNLSLGTAVHFALEQMFRGIREEGGAKGEERRAELLVNFKRALEKQLLNPEDLQAAMTEGEKLLGEYWDFYHESFKAPVFVEYSFRSHDVVLPLPGAEPVRLSGKIDRVDWVDEQEGLVRVVDYKTSRPRSLNDIKGLTAKEDAGIFRQMVFYKLLSDLDPNFKAPGKVQKLKVAGAQIDFIKSDKGRFSRLDVPIEEQDIADLKQTISEVMGRIRKLDFGTGDEPGCGECEWCKRFG